MSTIENLINEYYDEFKGLPSYNPIVRNNQKSDAFELVVLKIMFGKVLPEFKKENIDKLSEYIIAPPDSSIDIFFQHENGDEYSFDVIQVKNSELKEKELSDAITLMKRTIDDYCKDPKVISENCREILSKSNLDKSNKSKCNYYIVHTGNIDDFKNSHDGEKVITKKMLETVYTNVGEYVDKDELKIISNMNYGDLDAGSGAIVCSLNGYDLAILCNNYFSTEAGRNLLFGSNLRESLITKKSKPYLSMSKTILECPENFWYYNNGITIIAKDIVQKSDDEIELKSFSIVNGAQTTSALGLFLKEAKKNHETENIDNLKKVYILTRILKIPDDKMRQEIAIFNNSQTPITTRDMVANRPEQKHLYEWLIDDTYPSIYVEIRRGSKLPATFNKGITHRKTTNEELAQLVYAAFFQKPFTAKDKKSALFNNDYTQTEYVINKIYHDVFNWDGENNENNGEIFKRTKKEIDELLFVKELYKETKKHIKANYQERLENFKKNKETASSDEQRKMYDDRITTTSLYLDTVGICMFYFVALYYELKLSYKQDESKDYNFDKYYSSDKKFKENLISDAANLFLINTIKILVNTAIQNGKSGNINNWIRSSHCEGAFISALRDMVASDFELESKYNDFCNEYRR